MRAPHWWTIRNREYIIIAFAVGVLVLDLLNIIQSHWLLITIAVVGVLPTLWAGILALKEKYISIDVFNSLAVILSLSVKEWKSAVFIILMLAAARILEDYTESKSHKAVEELLKLKPEKAYLETADGQVEEIGLDKVQKNQVLIVKAGQRIAVDGKVSFGSGYVNEASISGESKPVEKVVGNEVFAGTLLENGVIKIVATRVGKDSTLEKMAELVALAGKNKSQTHKLADKFAGVFLPGVLVLGLVVYLISDSVTMVISLFLVACADDIAVSIPLAMTASLGRAAKRGVIIKGGQYLDALGQLKVLVFDKTGTLTMGSLFVDSVQLAFGVNEKKMWGLVASSEKMSDHPMGKALYHYAVKKSEQLPQDPEHFETIHGQGVCAVVEGREVVIGNSALVERKRLNHSGPELDKNLVYIFVESKLQATLKIKDVPRTEAKSALVKLKSLGVEKLVMFTGDNLETAREISEALGITDYKAFMKPEDKLKELEKLSQLGLVGMVGDGINDAPALARSSVGIAMGSGGTAVAVEAADVVILTDNLERLPEMVELGRRTRSVVFGDVWIWVITNGVGFILVFMGILNPILAASYNFVTDFFPMLNSLRLFRHKKSNKKNKPNQ